MKPVGVRNETKSTRLFTRGFLAVEWRERLIGLMGRKELGAGEGLVIRPCESIHTCWMRFVLDVVFVDVEEVVVRVYREVNPWRMRFGGRHADTVIEGPAGMIDRSATQVGDRLRIVPLSESSSPSA